MLHIHRSAVRSATNAEFLFDPLAVAHAPKVCEYGRATLRLYQARRSSQRVATTVVGAGKSINGVVRRASKYYTQSLCIPDLQRFGGSVAELTELSFIGAKRLFGASPVSRCPGALGNFLNERTSALVQSRGMVDWTLNSATNRSPLTTAATTAPRTFATSPAVRVPKHTERLTPAS